MSKISLPGANIVIVGDLPEDSVNYWRKCFNGAHSVQNVSTLSNIASLKDPPNLIVIPRAHNLALCDLELVQKMVQTPIQLLLVTHATETTIEQLAEICGFSNQIGLGNSEWFLKQLGSRNQTAEFGEFAIRGEAVELIPSTPTVETLAQISVGFRNRSVLIRNATVTTLSFSECNVREPDINFVRMLHRAVFDPIPEAKMPINVGIIGYGPFGGMGHFHGEGCEKTQYLKFVAIGEHDNNRRQSALQQFPTISTYENDDDLINDQNVDLVIVATPPNTHFNLAKKALANGKHVVIEKPMCLTTSEVDQLIEISRVQNKVLTIHQNRRFDGDFLALLALIDSGVLGDVFNIETFVGSFEHPCRAWHSDSDISGGSAYDWGSHHIDWILRIYKESPQELFVTSHKRVWKDVTNADQIRIHMTLGDGREAEFIQSEVSAIRKPKFYVQGTKGTAAGHYAPITSESVNFPFGYQVTKFHHAEVPVTFVLTTYDSPTKSTTTEITPVDVPPFEFHRNLANHLIYGEPLSITPESVRPVIEILEVSQALTETDQHYAKL